MSVCCMILAWRSDVQMMVCSVINVDYRSVQSTHLFAAAILTQLTVSDFFPTFCSGDWLAHMAPCGQSWSWLCLLSGPATDHGKDHLPGGTLPTAAAAF